MPQCNLGEQNHKTRYIFTFPKMLKRKKYLKFGRGFDN